MRRGLTLLEVLVAAIVLAIGVVATLEVAAHCSRATLQVEDHARAMMFARSKLEEVLKEPVLQTGQDQGQGVDETTDYDWQVVISQSQHPSLLTIGVKVTNRITGKEVFLSALRRPDLNPPEPTDTGTTNPGDQPETEPQPGGGA